MSEKLQSFYQGRELASVLIVADPIFGCSSLLFQKISLIVKTSLDSYTTFGNWDFTGALHPIPEYA